MIKPTPINPLDAARNSPPLVEIKTRHNSLPKLVVTQLVVDEDLEGSYQVGVNVHVRRNEAGQIHAEALLGSFFQVSVTTPTGNRDFGGLLTELEVKHTTPEFVHFFLRLESWLVLLKHTTDSRVYENQTALQILDLVVEELKAGPYGSEIEVDDRTRRKLTSRDFLVQYNESNYQFIKRLFEEEGIYFRADYRNEQCVITLLDGDPEVHKALHPPSTFRHAEKTSELRQSNSIFKWDESRKLIAGEYSADDYFYQTPKNKLDVAVQSHVKLGPSTVPDPKVPLEVKGDHNQSLEHRVFGEGFVEPFNERESRLDQIKREGQLRTILRTQRAEATHRVIAAESTIAELAPGFRFNRHRDFQAGEADPKAGFLVTSIRHILSFDSGAVADQATDSGSRFSERFDNGGMWYRNAFTCIPAETVFRPARSTAKSKIHGTQTAVVVGPVDEEIHVDDLGRIRVRFHFDRSQPGTESECWVRVSQVAASNRWGAFFWPRVNDEVIVSFINGDPDRPLVTGSLYHANHLPPHALPEHKTRSGFVTRSSPKGSLKNANELRFEDKKGHEQILIHAERSLITEVEANENKSVGTSRKTTIRKDDSLTLKEGDRSAEILEGNDSLVIQKGDRETTLEEGTDRLIVSKGDRVNNVPEGQFTVDAEEIILTGKRLIQLRVGETTLTLKEKSLTLTTEGVEVELTPHQLMQQAKVITSKASGPHNLEGLPINLNC